MALAKLHLGHEPKVCSSSRASVAWARGTSRSRSPNCRATAVLHVRGDWALQR